MESDESIFKTHYRSYIAQLNNVDLDKVKNVLGIEMRNGAALIPLLGKMYQVSSDGIKDEADKKPSYDVCVILSKYLLMCPESEPGEKAWAAFRDFKDSAPLIDTFSNDVERSICRRFGGRTDDLVAASQTLQGRPPGEPLSYDIVCRFPALPRVPLLMLFNDKDEEFPASCSVLFEKRAERFLDPESLAILGWRLFFELNRGFRA